MEKLATAMINSAKTRRKARRDRKKNKRQNKLNDASFASEMWFEAKLREAGLTGYERNAPMNIYFIDFFFVNLKIAVEIDGGYHKKRKFWDGLRDEYMSNNGVVTYRINDGDELRANEVLEILKKKD